MKIKHTFLTILAAVVCGLGGVYGQEQKCVEKPYRSKTGALFPVEPPQEFYEVLYMRGGKIGLQPLGKEKTIYESFEDALKEKKLYCLQEIEYIETLEEFSFEEIITPEVIDIYDWILRARKDSATLSNKWVADGLFDIDLIREFRKLWIEFYIEQGKMRPNATVEKLWREYCNKVYRHFGIKERAPHFGVMSPGLYARALLVYRLSTIGVLYAKNRDLEEGEAEQLKETKDRTEDSKGRQNLPTQQTQPPTTAPQKPTDTPQPPQNINPPRPSEPIRPVQSQPFEPKPSAPQVTPQKIAAMDGEYFRTDVFQKQIEQKIAALAALPRKELAARVYSFLYAAYSSGHPDGSRVTIFRTLPLTPAFVSQTDTEIEVMRMLDMFALKMNKAKSYGPSINLPTNTIKNLCTRRWGAIQAWHRLTIERFANQLSPERFAIANRYSTKVCGPASDPFNKKKIQGRLNTLKAMQRIAMAEGNTLAGKGFDIALKERLQLIETLKKYVNLDPRFIPSEKNQVVDALTSLGEIESNLNPGAQDSSVPKYMQRSLLPGEQKLQGVNGTFQMQGYVKNGSMEAYARKNQKFNELYLHTGTALVNRREIATVFTSEELSLAKNNKEITDAVIRMIIR